MCMNPRKAFGEKTWQETKFYAEGIDDEWGMSVSDC
jgi:hypothetical protein